MKIVLMNPPSCDPTMPSLAVPTLTGWMRSRGYEVVQIDANAAAYDHMLRPDFMTAVLQRIEKRLHVLRRKKSLGHCDQLTVVSLACALEEAGNAPDYVSSAIATLRDKSLTDFLDPQKYEHARSVIDACLRLISAAWAPLELTFLAYRTPFALLGKEAIRAEARPERNPFQEYFDQVLIDRIEREKARVVGISLTFPGQIQPAFSLAYRLRERMPGLVMLLGGPALTQTMVRLAPRFQHDFLGPCDAAVMFEGEETLAQIMKDFNKGTAPHGIYQGQTADLTVHPGPDFDGLDFGHYLSPVTVLPYDPSRGCYWGRCAFCHYGLTPRGTACYRERPLELMLEHLDRFIREGNRLVYFSHDTFLPTTAARLARGIKERRLGIRWASDMRPERKLTPDLCRELADGGCLSIALGVESASPRILALIDKGVTVSDMEKAINNLSRAGIAVEAMCFRDFPGETVAEALATVKFIERNREKIALFIDGDFALLAGARVALDPAAFGVEEVWTVKGDPFRTGIFYREKQPAKSDLESDRVDRAIALLARKWWLHRYPWAGALSTAHTLLYFDQCGPAIFRTIASRKQPRPPQLSRAEISFPEYDLAALMDRTATNESALWERLIHDRRDVSPELYLRLAAKVPKIPLSPRRK